MKKKLSVFFAILAVFLAALINSGCKVQYVPVETIKEVHTIDSVYLRDTTIQYRIEKEFIRDYTGLLDTLRMETTYSKFVAFVDTSSAKLSGTAKNKEKMIDVPVSVKEKVVVRDSVVYKEVPIRVEVPVRYTPKIWKILGWIGILSLVAGVLLILRKFGVL